MKKALLSTALSLFLLSCTAQQLTELSVATGAFIKQIQQDVATFCSFAGNIVPEADAIVTLVNATVGATITGIAASIEALACPITPAPTAVPGSNVTVKAGSTPVVMTFIKFGK
jgi:hypothetical protein